MRKLKVITAVLGLGLGFAAVTPAAHAISLIPTTEGEVQLENMEPLDSDNTIDLGFNITSLMFDSNYSLSKLFVDKKGTANSYGNGINFGSTDKGTTEELGKTYLRAVAIDDEGNAIEGGELEVGRFLFDFGDEKVDEITLEFFDTEISDVTGILQLNGMGTENMLLQGQSDGNTQTITLNDVSSFVLQLGTTGDGVTLSGIQSSKEFAVADVPEPTTTLSLGALAVAGMFGVKKRKNLKK